MTITKLEAWTVFKAVTLQQPEALAAFSKLIDSDEAEAAYEAYEAEFQMRLAEIGVEAQNEAAALTKDNDDIAYLETKKPWDWKATDYITVVTVFKGSEFEKLHLSALFRVPNTELLLDLVKP